MMKGSSRWIGGNDNVGAKKEVKIKSEAKGK